MSRRIAPNPFDPGSVYFSLGTSSAGFRVKNPPGIEDDGKGLPANRSAGRESEHLRLRRFFQGHHRHLRA
jgi:hypothetical protein